MSETKKLGQYSVKYRPVDTDSVIGNEDAKREVESIAEKQDAHAILMYGPSGCGKTTLAKILARRLTNNSKIDIVDKNIGDENGINDVRSLIAQSKYMPNGPRKVFILDEAHALRGQAQSAILKTIEEPEHDRVVWILCTDRPQMLEAPLLNRLYKIGVQKPAQEELAKMLYRVVKHEKLFDFNEKQKKRICLEIASAADRVPREALQLLHALGKKQNAFSDFKELVIEGIRKNAEQTIDKTALQVLMAFYSDQKPFKERINFLVSQLHEKDLWALSMRLTDIHHHLLNTIGGIRGGPGYYYSKQLESSNSIPELRIAVQVAIRLVELRNTLQQVNTKIEHFILPKLLDLAYEVEAMRNGESKRK
jgi:DNA polymerase III delta prime subunit